MLTIRGSQRRENIEDTDYVIRVKYVDCIVVTDGQNVEVWAKNDNFAGYVLVVDGIGYEFSRSI